MILFTPFDDGQIIQPRGGRTTVDVVQVRQSLFYFSTWWATPPRLEGWPMQNTVFSSSFPQFLFFSCSTTRKLLAIVQKIKKSQKRLQPLGDGKKKKEEQRQEEKKGRIGTQRFSPTSAATPLRFPHHPFHLFSSFHFRRYGGGGVQQRCVGVAESCCVNNKNNPAIVSCLVQVLCSSISILHVYVMGERGAIAPDDSSFSCSRWLISCHGPAPSFRRGYSSQHLLGGRNPHLICDILVFPLARLRSRSAIAKRPSSCYFFSLGRKVGKFRNFSDPSIKKKKTEKIRGCK